MIQIYYNLSIYSSTCHLPLLSTSRYIYNQNKYSFYHLVSIRQRDGKRVTVLLVKKVLISRITFLVCVSVSLSDFVDTKIV